MTDLFKNKYRISSARLQTWDYANNGLYFVTICTANRECFFGDVVETQCIASPTDISEYKMQLNDLGKIVELEWLKSPEIRPDMNLELAEYIVMPNHFHGILFIGDNQFNIEKYYNNQGDAIHYVPTISSENDIYPPNEQKNKFGPQSKNLAAVIRGFKSVVTTYARKNNIQFDWQARFHDHIITSNNEYLKIAEYIINNPKNWREDRFYVK
ncbi:transposase [Mucilaginibacter sp.]|uniref:transposase n=1 Tax=Mucilaginibacter sp. TaxID=1882438 RepID=UPI002850EB11|nr:transposase [Mucilaginibacter sp.]MDR3697966.1 hypothetical protein [Mucilaginibacter sp.]